MFLKKIGKNYFCHPSQKSFFSRFLQASSLNDYKNIFILFPLVFGGLLLQLNLVVKVEDSFFDGIGCPAIGLGRTEI